MHGYSLACLSRDLSAFGHIYRPLACFKFVSKALTLEDINMAKILLAKGARGEIVRKVQRRLEALGFDPQGVDGRFGKYTQGAVSSFQHANELEQTGEVDIVTWERLMSTPPPSVKERSLQITAAFEGHDFTLAEGNYDGAGITWG